MTQLTLNIEDNATVKIIKKILKAFDGVTIIKQTKPHKSGIEEAYDDVRAGRVCSDANVDEMLNRILGK